jgi:hypothetical protein
MRPADGEDRPLKVGKPSVLAAADWASPWELDTGAMRPWSMVAG